MTNQQTKPLFNRMITLRNSIIDNDNMTSIEFTTLSALFFFSDKYGKCKPSYAQLQKLTKLSRASISKAIKLLVEAGLIEYKKGSNKDMIANEYHLSPKMLGLDVPENVVEFPTHDLPKSQIAYHKFINGKSLNSDEIALIEQEITLSHVEQYQLEYVKKTLSNVVNA